VRRRVARPRDERGSAVVELVWLGVLLIVPLLWIVVAVFEVQGGAFAVSSAARSAGRAFALAPDDASGQRAAEAAARQALDDQGLDDVAVDVDVSCTPYPDACHTGTSVITVRVASRVVLPLMPDFLGGDRPSFALDATHTVPIGRYVSADPGGTP
jgi:Flp pilus assembly protein TadG